MKLKSLKMKGLKTKEQILQIYLTTQKTLGHQWVQNSLRRVNIAELQQRVLIQILMLIQI